MTRERTISAEPVRPDDAPQGRTGETAAPGDRQAPGALSRPLSRPLSGPPSGPLPGLERAAFFAALRRKADARLATFG